MTLDSWNSLFNIVAVLSAGITFAAGAGALATGNILNSRQAERFSEQQERAANAERDAAEAKILAGKAGDGTAKALAEAAAVTERAGALELETAKQQERAAIAERSLLALQERLKPRTLTTDQTEALIVGLSGKATCPLQIFASIGDAEAQAFAELLNTVFEKAGWKPKMGVAPMTSSAVGVQVAQRNPGTPLTCTAVIAEALTSAQIPFELLYSPFTPADGVTVAVGPKR